MRFDRFPAFAFAFAFAFACSCSANDEEASRNLGPCAADAYEPNDSASLAKPLGAIQDDDELPGSDAEELPTMVRKSLTSHGSGDVDWFTVDINDTGIGGNPGLSVIVSSAYEATAWFTCTNGTTESVICGLGAPVTDDPEFTGRGCVTKADAGGSTSINVNLTIECAGTSTDSGNLTVRVRRRVASEACERYDLTVGAD